MKSAAKSVKLETVLTKSASGWCSLHVSPEIANRFQSDGKTRRVVCTLNDSHTFQCALMPNKGHFTIAVNKQTRKKLNLDEGDTVTVLLEPDTSEYGMPMPEDFSEVLGQDPEGDRLFHALTRGMQRSLIYMIGIPKHIDKRIHLGLIVLEHLKDNGGRIDRAQLQQDIKRPLI